MPYARRLASIAVVALTGLLALTGCRADPTVAAYVGSERYTEDRIGQIYDDAQAKVTAALGEPAPTGQPGASPSPAPAPAEVKLPFTRRDIVVALVGRDLLKAVAEKKGIAKADLPVEQVIQQRKLPANTPRDTEFVQIWTEHEAYRVALLQKLPGRTPTEAELRDLFDRLVKGGLVEPQATFTQFASSLNDEQRTYVGGLMAVRDAVEEQMRGVDIVVNPRYAPAELVVDSFQDAQQALRPLLSVSLDASEPYVRDAA